LVILGYNCRNMKASLENIRAKKKNSSIVAYTYKMSTYDIFWHYHPEIELTLVNKGKGNRIVGDNISPIEENDLVLLGSNLPHGYNWSQHMVDNDGFYSSTVIQFKEDIFNFKVEEFLIFKRLLSNAKRGIVFSSQAVEKIKPKIHQCTEAEGIDRILILYDILKELLLDKDAQVIASPKYSYSFKKNDVNHIDKICKYVHDNYGQSITIEEISQIAGMTETSFCRYFKKNIGMPFMSYINEIRISEACSLLMNTKKPVSEIAYLTGFNSISHFNRMFQKLRSSSPSQFKKSFSIS